MIFIVYIIYNTYIDYNKSKMDSYTVSIKINDYKNMIMFTLLQNNNIFVEFEFKNTVPINEWKRFIDNIENVDSDEEYELLLQKKSGNISICARGNIFQFTVGSSSNGDVTVHLIKNQSLYDALNELLVKLEEN